MEPPPSRYRVIERDGRLVVIDAAAGVQPPTARDLLPEMASDDWTNAPMLLADAPANEPALEQRAAPRPSPTRYAAAQSMIAEPPGLLRNVASTVCSDTRDGDGRLQWTTARWFDAKGVRAVALSPSAERQLGFVTLALMASAVAAVILVVMGDMLGWITVFAAILLLRQAKPVSTAWIDRLAAG